MSLILDALRKMEQERKSRRGAADLRPEVLRYRGELKPKQGKPYLLVTCAVMLIAAGGGAGFLVKGKLARTEPEQHATAPSIPPQAVVVAEPAPPAPAPAVAPSSAPAAPTAAAPATDRVTPAAETVAASATPPTLAAKPRRTVAVRKPSLTPPAASAAPRNRPESSPELQGTIPDITVSGIAWQEERGLRRAVLNGALVAEGAEVAGARVVEIKESRVRLSRGGQIFDLLLSSGLSSR